MEEYLLEDNEYKIITNEFTEELLKKRCKHCKYSIKIIDKKISNEPTKLLCIRFPPTSQRVPKKKDKYLFPLEYEMITNQTHLSIGATACAEYEKEFNWQNHLNGKE